MITFFDKQGEILGTYDPEGSRHNLFFPSHGGPEFFQAIGQVEYAIARYEEHFELAFKMVGSPVRPSSVAGKEVYTFVGDEARTIAANL